MPKLSSTEKANLAEIITDDLDEDRGLWVDDDEIDQTLDSDDYFSGSNTIDDALNDYANYWNGFGK